MSKDFVSIIDLMPKIFELAKKDYNQYATVRQYSSNGDLYQYDVIEADDDNRYKRLLFVDRRYHDTKTYVDSTGQLTDAHVLQNRSERRQEHKPYVYGYAYDVPELLEVHYLRNSPHIDYITEEYMDVLENMYYQYLLLYTRSCDPSIIINEHDYEEDKESNIIYRALNEHDMVFQLNPNDDDFVDTITSLVVDKSEVLSKVKKTTISDKRKLHFALYPSRDLDDLLDYKQFYEDTTSYYRPSSSSAFEELSQYLPMLILHIATAQERQTYIGARYPEYLELVSELPIRLNQHTPSMEDGWLIQEAVNRHMTISNREEVRLNKISYGHGVGTSKNRQSNFDRVEYLDGEINLWLYHNIYNQIRLMMFGTEDVPVPIDSLSTFENEVWRDNAGLRISMNASTLEWRELNE